MMEVFSEDEIQSINDQLESCNPPAVLYWAARHFGSKMAVSSSFQMQSVPLLYWIGKICPNVPVFFLDTGFHFDETKAFRNLLIRSFGINVQSLTPLIGHKSFSQKYPDLHESDPNMCCYLNKVEPLERALAGYDLWVSGIRRDQTVARADTPIFSKNANGLWKLCPLANATRDDISQYIETNELPQHPLYDQGYWSIGCQPCTKAVKEGEDERSGRWAGSEKTECGIHFDPKTGKIQRMN
jgi:phosphoadenosine phosphosulfate reductase